MDFHIRHYALEVYVFRLSIQEQRAQCLYFYDVFSLILQCVSETTGKLLEKERDH